MSSQPPSPTPDPEPSLLERPRVPDLDSILGKQFRVLDDGFVRVTDYMGSDASIVQAARVSYGVGTKHIHGDRGLIRYLMRHGHTTPFEMCEIKLHVRVPMDCWRQWIRHRTSSWFFEDARASGSDADLVQASVERMARFFHQLRYSDKPVESALTTFSFSEATVFERARKTIRQAHDTSLLLRVISGAKDRNEGVAAKYQLNPMLCPRFDLSLSRRGTIALSAQEVEAIFGTRPENFDAVLGERLVRMNAPFRRRTRGKSGSQGDDGQSVLPGLG